MQAMVTKDFEMAPKKKPAKGGKGGDDEGPDQAEMNGILEAQVESLKQRLVMQQERYNRSMAKQEEIQIEEGKMDEEMTKHKGQTFEMVKSMTHTYREMEKGLQTTIDNHQIRVRGQDEQKRRLKEEIAALQQAKIEMENQKNAEIRKLKEQLDEVSSDFANLLKNQLNKFQQRVVQGHQSFEQNQESNADMDANDL